MPLYVKNAWHLQYANWTVKSIVSRENQVTFIPVENYIAPDFLPFNYPIVGGIQVEVQQGRGVVDQSVSSAWNIGITKAIELGNEYIIIINADIILKSNSIDRIVAFADAHSEPEYVMWTMGQYAPDPSKEIGVMEYDRIVADLETAPEDENVSEHPNFSSFMVKNTIQDVVGLFDENIKPAYFEDNDFHARIALDNKKAVVYGGARFYHFGSRTINSDPILREEMPPLFRNNEKYFIDKWGTKNVPEVDDMRKVYWKHPYNEEDKPLSYWRK